MSLGETMRPRKLNLKLRAATTGESAAVSQFLIKSGRVSLVAEGFFDCACANLPDMIAVQRPAITKNPSEINLALALPS
jgi:hypothetical protein